MEQSYTSGFWKSYFTSAKLSITPNSVLQPSPCDKHHYFTNKQFSIPQEDVRRTFPGLRSLVLNWCCLLHFEEVSRQGSSPPPAGPRVNPPSPRCSLCHCAAPRSATAVLEDLDRGRERMFVGQGGQNTFDHEHMAHSNRLPTSFLL